MEDFILNDTTRTRAWRRGQKRKHADYSTARPPTLWKLEKNWKMMYLRSEKIRRAKQLGFIYHLRQSDFEAEWFG